MSKWAKIPGFPNYKVSSRGKVRSIDRTISRNGRRTFKPGVLLKQSTDRDGYYKVSLYLDGKLHVRRVHQLVLLAFVGPCPENKQVRHRDGDKENNCKSNLRYGTCLKNNRDKIRHGTSLKGEENPRAILTTKQVKYIRKKIIKGHARFGLRPLSRKFGVSASTLLSVIDGTHWRHV